MAEQRSRPIVDLDRALHDLGDHLAFPIAEDLAQRVRQQLLSGPAPSILPDPPGRLSLTRRWRRVAAIVLAAVLLLTLLLAVSPGARAAVTSWLRLGGVVIEINPRAPLPTPAPVAAHLDLGAPIALAEAVRRVGFSLAAPKDLGRPDEVYLGGPRHGQVALVYRARQGLPRAGTTGVGLLLTEFKAYIEPTFFKKLVTMGAHLDTVTVAGVTAYWLSGQPHFFGYVDRDGNIAIEQMRLAGNTLLWERDGITYRLEADIPLDRALHIAASLRPVTVAPTN